MVQTAAIRHLIVDAGRREIAVALAAKHPDLVVVRPEVEEVTGRLPTPTPNDLAIVQFTSGTTGHPRGVMLSHRTVLAGLRAILISAEFTRDDVLVQWVPTYHDMGLFGLLSQVLNGASTHVFDSLRFLRDPACLLRHLTEHGGTVITGPSFGYTMLADTVDRHGDHGLALEGLRLAFNGAEPVQSSDIELFDKILSPVGYRPEAMFPVYGLAEATLAATFPVPGRLPRIIHADRNLLAEGAAVRLVPEGHPQQKALVGVGRPVHGMELRIVGMDGEPRTEGTVGEIQICGAAVTTGVTAQVVDYA
ncbi:AMP-binding protein [Streptomyces sp. NPDC051172]|uniref:AMP-binding protein n=1 Tax=Streptomyces sp. NPDC051172 TaxID=3155796 RepID=UPI00343E4D60